MSFINWQLITKSGEIAAFFANATTKPEKKLFLSAYEFIKFCNNLIISFYFKKALNLMPQTLCVIKI